MEDKKSILLSKTVWMNFVMAGLAFVPSISELIKNNMELYAMIWGGVATLLRLISKDKVVLW